MMLRRRLSGLAAFVLILSLFVSSVSAAQPVPRKVLDAAKSVVRIEVEDREGIFCGSGFVIKSDSSATLVVTNQHVVGDVPERISVWMGADNTVPATVLTSSAQKDFCVLQLDHPISLPRLCFSTRASEQGDAVYAVGFPGAADYLSDTEAHTGGEATITDGIVSAVRQATLSDGGQAVKLLQVTAAINAGNSGGPLFNTQGEIVGICTYSVGEAQGIFGAVDVSEVAEMLTDLRVDPYHTGPSFWTIALCVAVVLAVLGAAVICLWRRRRKRLEQAAAASSLGATLLEAPTQDELPTEDAMERRESEGRPSEKESSVAPKRKKGSWVRKLAIVCAAVVVLTAGTYGGCYFYAACQAEAGAYSTADRFLFCKPCTRLHDPQLLDYIAAGVTLETGEYDRAKDLFALLGSYRAADQMVYECDYRRAVQTLEGSEQFGFRDAYNLFQTLSEAGYAKADEMCDETQYRWAKDLLEKENYLQAYNKLEGIRDYRDAGQLYDQTCENIYTEGKKRYRRGDYAIAALYFSKIDPYLRSADYLCLTDIWGSTPSEMKPEGEAKEYVAHIFSMFDFENAKETLLARTWIGNAYLKGRWEGNGYYLNVGADGEWSYNLPGIQVSKDKRRLMNGLLEKVLSWRDHNNKNIFSLEVITKDSIRVYCYQNGQTYTLYRT